jgi:2'-5' RNA ligase
MITIDLVTQEATKGRGLWIGMFVPAGHGELTSLHVTLAHLGKSKNGERAHHAAMIVGGLAVGAQELEVWTWGQARLDQFAGCARVVLLESFALLALQRELCFAISAEPSLKIDRTFHFHPHLTLAKHAADQPVTLHRRARQRVTLPTISLVCGEGRVDYKLGT